MTLIAYQKAFLLTSKILAHRVHERHLAEKPCKFRYVFAVELYVI